MALVAEYERAYSRKSPAARKVEMSAPSPILESPRSQFAPQQLSTAHGAKDEEWVMLTSPEATQGGDKENRVWLEPSSDEDEEEAAPKDSSLALPSRTLGSSTGSTDAPYISATTLVDGENENDPPSPRLLSCR